MLRSIYTKTLRDYRVAILGWGLGLALVIYAQLAAYGTQITSPEARASAVTLAQSFRFFADAVAVDTPTGYVTWKTMGSLPLLLGIWAVLAGSRLVRGAEERGALDMVLATPRSRARYLGEGIGALVTALALIGILIGLGAMAGEAGAKVPVAAGGALLAGLNVSLMALLIGMVALLLSQFLARAGAAAGAAAGLMVLAWVVDGTGRAVQNGAWISRLSPYHLYMMSKPLIASAGANPAAMLSLVALAAICGAASVPLFARRDLGGTVWQGRWAARQADQSHALARAAGDASLRGILPRALRADLTMIVWWIIGPALFVAGSTGIVRATKDSVNSMLNGSPLIQELLRGLGSGTDAGFFSAILFLYLPILLTVYALMQAESWARNLDAGRYELVLSTPTPRWRIFLDAWGATLIALVVAPLILWLVAVVSIRAFNLQVPAGDLAVAFIGLLPLELVVAGLVYLIGGRLTASAITGVIGGLIAVSFFVEFLDPVLKLPGWLAGLSIFHQYGNPIMSGPAWGGWLGVTVVAAAFVLLGLARFTRNDLPRGI
jgi:ABC-2 type transport system permease protein